MADFWSGLRDALLGTPGGVQQIQTPRYNPQQEQILNQLLSMGLGGLQNPTQGFEPIQNQAISQFHSQTVPSLAERFTSMGGGDTSLGSSGFQGALGSAGAGLSEALAALKAQYGQQQQSHFSNLLGMGLQPRQDTLSLQTPGSSGFLGSLLPSIGRLGAHAGAAGLTGGASAVPSALVEVLRLMGGSPQASQRAGVL